MNEYMITYMEADTLCSNIYLFLSSGISVLLIDKIKVLVEKRL